MEREKLKDLVKIIIAAAWIDGEIQPEERQHIHRIARENNLSQDPEIKLMLSEAKKIKPEECYLWLEQYLDKYNTEKDYYDLLEEISGLIYIDDLVHTEETKLLTKLQVLNPKERKDPSIYQGIIKTIQKLYQLAINPSAR